MSKKKVVKKEKKNINKEKKVIDTKWIKENQTIISLTIISLLCLLVGTFVIGFLLSFILVAVVDAIAYLFMIRKKKGKRKGKVSIWKLILLVIFSFGILMLILVSCFFVWIAMNAQDFDPDKMYQKDATILYDKNGEIAAKLGTEKRENITYEEMPDVLIDAIIATEDSRFFQHNGFDLPRFLKATFGQLVGQSGAGGASTLTMQLSKNIYTSTEDEGIQGIIRKFTDIYMSIFKIEKKYTKQEILEFYVNYNYLGGSSRGSAYGVEQACIIYFGKHAKDINLSEAALIAGLFNSPNKLDPLKNPEGAEKRRNTVLYLMQLHGYITEEEKEIAKSIPVEDLITDEYETGLYSGFIDTVVEEVIEKTGKDPYTTPMEIYSTMDKNKQAHIDGIMSGEKTKWKDSAIQAGIAVLDTKTGAVLAIGANRDLTSKKSYNYATMIEKQIGSTAKPLYDYGPAIQYNNYSTYTLYADEPTTYTNGPSVNNWDGSFQGLITMRTALMGSRNIPALKTFKAVDNAKIKEFVTKLGLSPEIESGKVHEAHAIGGYNGESPLTLAAAYAAFGNKGVYNEPYSFTKVIFRDTNETYENKTTSNKVMDEDTAYMVTSMLLDTGPAAIGYNCSKINNASVAIKTGTTNYPIEIFNTYPTLPKDTINDLWVAGYDPEFTMAIWYGYDKINQEYIDEGYYNSLSQIYNPHGFLYHDAGIGVFTDSSKFQQPNNVVSVTVEAETNPAKLPSEFTPKDKLVTELFKQGTEPTEISSRYSKLDSIKEIKSEIDKDSIKLTWDAIKTPEAIDEEKIKKYVNSLYFDAGYNASFLKSRLDYNKKYIGDVSYNVYIKNADGKLELLENVKDTEYTYKISNTTKPITFVVKTVYTIFKDNISDGTELTVDLKGVEDIIVIDFNGDIANIELKVDEEYFEKTEPIIVTDNLIDVTKEATIKKQIKNKNNEVVTEIKTDKEEVYTITYNITYKETKKELIQKITIKSAD